MAAKKDVQRVAQTVSTTADHLGLLWVVVMVGLWAVLMAVRSVGTKAMR